MPKVPENLYIKIKHEFMREYFFPEKYHNYVESVSLGKYRNKYYISVILHKLLPKKLAMPAKYNGLEVKIEL